MTSAAIKPKLTFEEYIDFCAQTEERYELVRGELIQMNPPIVLHYRIAKLLEQVLDAAIAQQFKDEQWETFCEAGQRTEDDSSRLPDVAIVSRAEADALLDQTAVFQAPSLLVVEIVSPSSASEDYSDKLKEYEALKVPEYWVVDPQGLGAAKYIGFPKQPTVSVYRLVNGKYTLLDDNGQPQRFRGSDRIESPTFPALDLTTAQLFQGRRSP
ncbi:MAG: Uma2 family endonuclease [Leptolyngbyaceae cyanobacterium SM1_3_5]|nr:Uma2 family endonuclease [Leptolyngbyaceae cyanobacterium SM1_3_5]